MKTSLVLGTALLLASAGCLLAPPALSSPTASYVGVTGTGDSPIALDSAGRLFAMAGSTINIFDSPTDLSSPTTCAVTLAAGATEAGTMAVDSAGRVYLSFPYQSKVNVYANPLTSCTAAAMQSITTAAYPRGIAVDSTGNLWVSAYNADVVQKFASPASSPLLSATYPVAGGPAGIALDGAEHAFASATDLNAVYRADLTAGSVAFVNLGLTGISNPISLTVQANGLIQVADNGGSIVLEFDTVSGGTSPTSSIDISSLSGGAGLFHLVGPVSSYFYAGFYNGPLVSISGLGVATTSGDSSQAPPPIMQQMPANAEGTCMGIDDAHVAYGTGISGGWSRAWGEWANDHQGGWVCSRTLRYSNAQGQWLIAT